MSRRFTRSRFFPGATLLALLWAPRLPAASNPEAAGSIPPSAAYLGQKPPGEKPEPFAPAILSANPFLGRLAFSPDGRECFFTVGDATYSSQRLFVTRYENGAWTPQVPAPFAAGFEKSGEPFFSPDGKRLHFTAKVRGSRTGTDIWVVDRAGHEWGTPARLPAPVNSDADEFCYSEVADGTGYFLSSRSGAPQVYRARQRPDRSIAAEQIPPPVLSVGTYEGDPCVPPDGRFLVFYSGRAGGFGGVDLQVSLPDGKGEWTAPVNLGPDFNTAGDEYGATLSPDGKVLFFVRHTPQRGEIYWVSTRAIEKLAAAPPAAANAPAAPPARSYAIQGKPSAVVQDHAAMLALAQQVEKDLKADLGTSGVQDQGARQRAYVGLYGIAMLKRDHAEARRYLELVRELQGNAPGRHLTGVITIPYMRAVERPGADFHATYRALLSAHLAPLPYEEVQGSLGAMKDGLAGASKEALVGAVEAGLDPVVKDGRLTREMASGLVSTAMNLEVILPVRDDVVNVLEAYLKNGKPAQGSASPAGKAPQAQLGAVAAPVEGPYFGQSLPGETPVPFAPGILASMNPWVESVAFSPDGTLCLLGLGDASYSSSRLFVSRRPDGAWTPFEEAPFSADFRRAGGPAFSADGKAVIFSGKKAAGSQDLWTVGRSAQGWGTPVALPSPVNGDGEDYPASLMADGTLYFSRAPSGLRSQIYVARKDKDRGQAWTVEMLGAPVNAQFYDGDPCIAPDGRFLVFYSARIGGTGGTDLYVSFRGARGEWGTPLNLGPAFNSPDDEYGAHLSPDGELLFFTRHGARENTIFWVRTSAIDRLKPSAS